MVTAEEQNKCLAVVNAAISELNRNQKATSEMGKAVECTYILAAGRYMCVWCVCVLVRACSRVLRRVFRFTCISTRTMSEYASIFVSRADRRRA